MYLKCNIGNDIVSNFSIIGTNTMRLISKQLFWKAVKNGLRYETKPFYKVY